MAIIAAVGFAAAFTALQDKQYRSTASLLFRQQLLDVQLTGVPLLTPNNDSAVASATNVGLVEQENVRVRTAARLGPGYTADNLKKKLDIQPQKRSDIVGVQATADSARESARIANAVAQAYLDVARLQTTKRINEAANRVRVAVASSELSTTERRSLRRSLIKLKLLSALGPQFVQFVQPAVAPSKAYSPRPVLNLVLGGLAGLVIGLALAFGIEHFDRRVRTRDELEREAGLPLLGTIPRSRRFDRPRSGAWQKDAEPFRQLAGTLRLAGGDRAIRSVLLMAPGSGSGTTTVALYLAAAAAEDSSEQVLLVEGNLQRPVLAELLELPEDDGLSALAHDGHGDRASHVKVVELGDGAGPLAVTPAGPPVANPAGVLRSEAVRRLISSGDNGYGFTVVDAPSLLLVSDVLPLIREVDAVVVVARLGRDTGPDLRRLRVELERLGVEPIGVVANYVRSRKNPYSSA